MSSVPATPMGQRRFQLVIPDGGQELIAQLSQRWTRRTAGPGSTALSSRTLPTRDFSCEGLEPRAPGPPERLQPGVSLSQRARVHGIDAACPLGTHRRKPALPQDLELLRHGRLRDTELPRDDL